MVGDRRLTRNGAVYKENSTKQGYLLTPDAAVLYGYTGLAEAGNFRLQRWIGDALLNITKDKEIPFEELMHCLADEATKLFKEHITLKRVDRSIIHTTMVFAGFMGNSDPVLALVSNFENETAHPDRIAWDSFKATVLRSDRHKAEGSATFLTGNVRGIKFKRWSELNDLLKQGKPTKALVGKSIDLLNEAAASPDSGNLIGKNKMVAYFAAPMNGTPPPPSSSFVSEHDSSVVYALDQINICPEARVFISDLQIRVQQDQAIIRAERSPNTPCSCGSNIKFKYCHGHGS